MPDDKLRILISSVRKAENLRERERGDVPKVTDNQREQQINNLMNPPKQVKEQNLSSDDLLEKMVNILESLGVRMEVWGCGCDGSPSVRFEYNGELIVAGSYCNFDMFKGAEDV